MFAVIFCAKKRTKAANKNWLVEAGVITLLDYCYMRVLGYLLLFTSCVSYAEKITVENVQFQALNSLLSLGLTSEANNEASGWYSVNLQKKLDGPFKVGYQNSGYSDEMDTNYEFKDIVEGSFLNGNKEGGWKYIYVYDDGVDVYVDQTIEVHYSNNLCVKSSFSGSIGHLMPKTKHTFKDTSLCNTKAISDKAWELWTIKYKELKRKGEL